MNFEKIGPWIVGGDFNIIRNNLEKIGGASITPNLIEEFSDYLSIIGLIGSDHKESYDMV